MLFILNGNGVPSEGKFSIYTESLGALNEK